MAIEVAHIDGWVLMSRQGSIGPVGGRWLIDVDDFVATHTDGVKESSRFEELSVGYVRPDIGSSYMLLMSCKCHEVVIVNSESAPGNISFCMNFLEADDVHLVCSADC